ncbi:aldo/keto reductase [Phenylobacterium sp.]|uniref:aldo/keto reductase n=1 Tax=Phenylobacterium sp. TaxID=1871053 RepID=UPI00260715AA|nr:aldo/keto reductase [Phenylobacterium sp.]
MLYRPLGRTGLEVSEIGFGCASWWAKPAFDERQAARLVHAAIDLGVTLFDTAASYGAGQAELRLGRALQGRDASRLVIASKAGSYADAGGRVRRDFSAAGIRASAERSLKRLGLEVLPILQLHGPALEELTPELLAVLAELKAQGRVRALGVNSFDPDVIAHAIGLPELDVVMVDYNVMRPDREPLIARAAAARKGVLAGMPLAMGHTGLKVASLKGPQDLWYAARGLVRHRREVASGLRFGFLHRLPEITGSQAALAYVLADPAVSAAVVGTTRLAHLREDAAASGLRLPGEAMMRIRAAQRGLR